MPHFETNKNERLLVEEFMFWAEYDLPGSITWNHILPILTKIGELGFYVQLTTFEYSSCRIWASKPNIKSYCSVISCGKNTIAKDNLLIITWNSIVKFIIWYNQNLK